MSGFVISVMSVLVCIAVYEVVKSLHNRVRIKFKVLPGGTMPKRGNSYAAGIDLYAKEDVVISARGSAAVSLGVAWEPSRSDVVMIIKGRSGLAFSGIEMSNAGVIDSDYRGEIKALLTNTTYKSYVVKKGDRCCQGVVVSLPRTSLKCAEDISCTERGEKGFGSTGR